MRAEVEDDPWANARARGTRGPLLRGARLLIVHADGRAGAALRSAMRQRGVFAASTVSAVQALAICARARPVDVVLLDLELPGARGRQLIARLRASGVAVVIALVQQCDVASFAEALREGADDCVVRPVPINEVLCRGAFLLRRAHRADGAAGEVVGNIGVDLDRRTITVRGAPVRLTRKEFGVLAELTRAGGATVSRRRLLVAVWQTDWQGGAQTVAVHVCTLRSKLGRPRAVQTVGHAGYRLVSAEPRAAVGATAAEKIKCPTDPCLWEARRC